MVFFSIVLNPFVLSSQCFSSQVILVADQSSGPEYTCDKNSSAEALVPSKPVSLTSLGRNDVQKCFVEQDVVYSLLSGDKPAALIDVRNSTEYSKFHIQNSLNIPLHAIKTKQFLAAAPIVIVDEGRSAGGIERTCMDLRRSGFDVFALRGGLSAWAQNGGILEGDALASRDLREMSQDELFDNKQFDEWVLLDFSKDGVSDLKRFFHHADIVSKRGNENRFIKDVESVFKSSNKKRSDVAVLAITQNGGDYEALTSLIKRSGVENVFFLEGGVAAYKKYMSSQTAIWSRVDYPPKRGCGA